MAGPNSKRKHKKLMKSQGYSGSDIQYVKSLRMDKDGNYRPKRRKNPQTVKAVGIRGWVKARAVKIVRDKKGRATSVRIKT